MVLYSGDVGQLSQMIDSHSRIFVLVDGNTINFCLPLFFEKTRISNFTLIEIPSGENCKNLDTVQKIWSQLVENHADRNSLLINLGGGVVSDMGGFAASCYQRGIGFINVPTTLLSMVDAAVGGKTGVDFQGLKNQIGLFSNPLAVYVDTDFLLTLPVREQKSGLAEMIKYGFISDKSFFDVQLPVSQEFVKRAIDAKEKITQKDPNEAGLRKVLNFGHTVGHAIETYLLDSQNYMLHGEAVAIGIIPALWLSEKYCGLDTKWAGFYKTLYKDKFDYFNLKDLNLNALIEIMRHDKKNADGKIRFVLVSEPEKPHYDIVVEECDIIESLNYLVDFLGDESSFGK
ncbi:MAG: 3-dehydroquinate synthase [Bacteroidales bacterium]|nr:3-dehydroquinate synthase [Bacteroidales bacterium]